MEALADHAERQRIKSTLVRSRTKLAKNRQQMLEARSDGFADHGLAGSGGLQHLTEHQGVVPTAGAGIQDVRQKLADERA